ncbi:MauE/DoxX family redox-associated membrane protein [Chryseobacterium sp. MDT2-18]|uniref:MauE/DoxX family redox-associated membrane protein n=1 Tax=Chryseobacterium sp. MDT2-18 TaxID=1259136 RepID=UPI0027D92D97|nr:MauE/DoxX family redox-associated membrane protein [Chryseobacterium sp. MDT2-18]
MKTLRKFFPIIISFFFVLLFIYASASKMLDFENFQVQLAQSPLLSAYAGFISYAVIILELVIAGLLCFHLTRLWGLFASFAIMVAFTVYIYLILNYSDFVPCSCGGILEKMGWAEHLIFNIAGVVIAGLAAIAAYPITPKAPIMYVTEEEWMANYWQRRKDRRVLVYIMVALLVMSAGSMVALFLSSEYIMKKENNFTRRYIPHALDFQKAMNIKVNSYYFMGYDDRNIYLGNTTAPLNILTVSRDLNKSYKYRIPLDVKNYRFKSIKLAYHSPFYYLFDGQVPIILKGKIGDNSPPEIISYKDMYFDWLSINSGDMVFRAQSKDHHNFILGTIDSLKRLKLHPEVLGQKNTGYIQNDGLLLSNPHQTGNLIYLYYYSNTFLVMNNDLSIQRRLKLISPPQTITEKLVTLKNGKTKIEAPQILNFSNAYLANHLLWVQSNIRGKFEETRQWQNASVIDLYRTDHHYYTGSFLVPHRQSKPLKDFLIIDNEFYALIDNEIVKYRCVQALKKQFQTGKAENLN